MSDRNTLLRLVHVAEHKARFCLTCGTVSYAERSCPSCGSVYLNPMRDSRYREVLVSLTGKRSCADMDDDELRKVLAFFVAAGFEPKAQASPKAVAERAERKARYGLLNEIARRAKQVLGPSWMTRVRRFVQVEVLKDDSSDLEDCSDIELRKVIGWINRTDRYNRKRTEGV